MQVSRGGFVGKTCALAKLNDSSGGKKSKRRSKEERKGMVETFVKRHQSLNNGNFPSLHLTHKEVGGSYYTVREIFRELIQENRVLAPPKLPPGEQNMEKLDNFLEKNPLGSISFDPNVHGLPPKDNQTLVNEYESRREKVLDSTRISELKKGNLDNDDVFNGITHTTMKNEEFEWDCEGQRDEGQIRLLSEDVVVETFPLRPVSSTIYNVGEKSSETEVLNDDLELANGKNESFVHDEIQLFDNNSNEVMDTKLEDDLVTSLQESTYENIASSSQHLDTNNSSNSLQHSTFEETTENKNKSDIQPSGTAQKQIVDATLNRINFELCEAAASKKSDSQEPNPIVSFIKTFVAAFVKFWSE